ncbi:protoporphyrinogen oxidase HemJ [Pseudomonas sp. F1_0610]|uniref:protoporphyrinogen oxidase HemJ n=1 Tax=Pseudomonas sp. F1_0610 TaxID=3114284 RepID=UPI0039C40F52
MFYLSFKALHLIAMVCWFAGLFYLPRLFVYHAASEDRISHERFCIMERKLYRGIMTPSLIATLIFGGCMLYMNPSWLKSGWLHLKLTLIFVLIIYHLLCGVFYKKFNNNNNRKSHVFYRWFNEAPVILLIGIIFLAILKPF